MAPGVIHKNFAELIQMILGLLAKNFTSTALLKSLVSCLGTILKRGTTPESWTMQDTKAHGLEKHKTLKQNDEKK